jgi:hypothetical protein
LSRGRYTTMAPDPWPQRCCVKCRTPYMCALPSCICHHGARYVPRDPAAGWISWDQVLTTQSRAQRSIYLADPNEWQIRWFIDHLIKIRPGYRQEHL